MYEYMSFINRNLFSQVLYLELVLSLWHNLKAEVLLYIHQYFWHWSWYREMYILAWVFLQVFPSIL